MIRLKIEKAMHSDGTGYTNALTTGLLLLSWLYGAAVRVRVLGYRSGRFKTKRLPCNVVSVGNITVGGTGKTPMTILLAEMLHRRGFNPVVISRGYKGGAEKLGGVVSDGSTFFMSAEDTGDEPWMMARRLQNIGIPVVVGQNRFNSGMLAVKSFQPDVILLDDGYQHLQLFRDLNLVLLDSTRPFGNSHLLPRGILREPVSSLFRGDIFILTRTCKGRQTPVDQLRNVIGSRPMYTASHKPYLARLVTAASQIGPPSSGASTDMDIRMLRGRRVFGFSGIAVNNDFKLTLESIGCELAGFAGFADHHPYSRDDVKALLRSVYHSGADIVCTTEKDYVRLSPQMPLPIDLAVMGVDMSLGSRREAFEDDIVRHLTNPRGSTSELRAS